MATDARRAAQRGGAALFTALCGLAQVGTQSVATLKDPTKWPSKVVEQVQADELLPGPFAVAGISAGGKANGKGKDKDRDADRAEAEACVSRSAKLLLALSLQVLHV